MTTADDILRLRLRRQLIVAESPAAPDDVVRHMCAMQAQDYAGALWSVGLRCRPAVGVGDIERALAAGRIIRTWPMRGTLHFVAPEDVRWMLNLLVPRVLPRAATRHAQLGLDDAVFDRAGKLFSARLRGGHALERAEAMALLESAGIRTEGQRGYHVLWVLAMRGLLCLGPVHGKQQTFVLLDEWVPPGSPQRDTPCREEALARLTGRYFAGHGPATVDDLAWWSGLTKTDARAGIASQRTPLERIEVEGREYWMPAEALDEIEALPPARPEAPDVLLLPGFDEFMLGYTDRAHQLGAHAERYGSTISANGMFASTLVVDGRIAGTWKRTLQSDGVEIVVRLFRTLTRAERKRLGLAAEAYGRFLGLTASVATKTASANPESGGTFIT